MDGRLEWLRSAPTDFWPGLTRLWHHGQVRGLGVAIVFSILLNAALVAAVLWPAMWPQRIMFGLWGASAVVWASGWIDARRFRRIRNARQRQDPHLDLFLSARGEYLRGRWPEAERQLDQLLSSAPEDVEARLLLATLLRHQERVAEAKEQLRRLQRWSRAAKWNIEIRREWEQLATLEFSAEEDDSASGGMERTAETPASPEAA